MIVAEQIARPSRSIDFSNTQTWVWTLTPNDWTGASKVIGSYREYSIQSNGPIIIEGSNNGTEWIQIMSIPQAAIVTLPHRVMMIRPLTLSKATVKVTLFLADPK